MSENIPNDCRFSSTHEWARLEEDGTVTIGISYYAQHALGDIVFIELPEIGNHVNAMEEIGVVESVKAASDLYNPIAGDIIAVNDMLKTHPALINSSPYDEGWLYKISPIHEEDLDELMNAEDYEEFVEED